MIFMVVRNVMVVGNRYYIIYVNNCLWLLFVDVIYYSDIFY